MTTQPRIQQLHQSGAVVGQTAVWDGALWVPGPASTGMDAVGAFNDYFDLTTGSYDYEFNGADTTTLPAGWSWVNQGASDYREVGGRAALGADGTGGSTSTQECHRMIVRALPSEASWNAVLRMPTLSCLPYAYFRGGLVLRDSSGGDYVTWGRRVTNDGLLSMMALDYWTALNTLGALSDSAYTGDVQTFIRIRKNSGTSYDFLCSADGITWQMFWSGYDPTADGMTLDQIGVVGSCPSGDYCQVGLDWFRVRY